jgi:hypothetical protein
MRYGLNYRSPHRAAINNHQTKNHHNPGKDEHYDSQHLFAHAWPPYAVQLSWDFIDYGMGIFQEIK